MFCSWLCRIGTPSEQWTKAVKMGEWRIKTAPFLTQATLWSEVVVHAFAALKQTRRYCGRKRAHRLTNLMLALHQSARTRLSKLNEACAHLLVIVLLPGTKSVSILVWTCHEISCLFAHSVDYVHLRTCSHFWMNFGKIRLLNATQWCFTCSWSWASPVFHPSRGHPAICRQRPLGILGDWWSSLTCEGAAKPLPSMTRIDPNVFSLQRTWCARRSAGPWLHWSMVDPPWTGIFSKNNQQPVRGHYLIKIS